METMKLKLRLPNSNKKKYNLDVSTDLITSIIYDDNSMVHMVKYDGDWYEINPIEKEELLKQCKNIIK